MVSVAAAAPMGSNSEKNSMEGVTKGRGKSSHEESKLYLLFPRSEVQQEFSNMNPSSHKVWVFSCSPCASWQHHWSWYVNKLPFIHLLHSICTMCHVVLDLLYCQGSVEQNQTHAQESIWNAVWTKCAFPSCVIWGRVGGGISSRPFGEYKFLRPFHVPLPIWLVSEAYPLLSKPNPWLKAQDLGGIVLLTIVTRGSAENSLDSREICPGLPNGIWESTACWIKLKATCVLESLWHRAGLQFSVSCS